MRRLLLAGLACVATAEPLAAETTRSFEVAARVVPGCIVATDAGGQWGSIDLGSTAGATGRTVEATLLSTAGSGIAIECTPGVTASLAADTGDHPAAGERRLQRSGGTDTIGYRLYADGSATPWSAAALPLSFASGTRLVPIRAVATLTGPTAAGRYTDTVRVTLSW